MAQSPQTIIELFSLPNVDNSYNYVTNIVGNIDGYFNALTKIFTYSNAKYIKKNSTIDLPVIFDNIEKCNYIRYNNGEGLGWEYAFVNHKEFISFGLTRIDTQYDVWINNLEILKNYSKDVLVSRASSNPRALINPYSDAPSYSTNASHPIPFDIDMTDMLHIVFKDTNSASDGGSIVNYYDVVESIDMVLTDDLDLSIFNDEMVKAIFYYTIPTTLLDRYYRKIAYVGASSTPYTGFGYDVINNSTTDVNVYRGDISLFYPQIAEEFDDYKSLTYPYTKLMIKTSYEEKELNIYDFGAINIFANISLSACGVTIYYRIPSKNGIYLIKDVGYQIPTVVTAYDTWLAYNRNHKQRMELQLTSQIARGSINATGQITSGAISMASGDISGVSNVIGGISTMANTTVSAIESVNLYKYNISDLKKAPANVFVCDSIDDMIMVMRNRGIAFYHYTMSPSEYKMVESYWNEFGYKINDYKPFNSLIRTRKYYNFLQISSPYIPNIFCNEDSAIIRQILSKGVHIYHTWYQDNNQVQYGELLSNSVNTYMGG